jgi:DICT domain-containing protein
VATRKTLTNSEFLSLVREYFPLDAVVWETDASSQPRHNALLKDLNEDTFYYFDAEAMLAVRLAIEDQALDEANGVLLAAVQDFRYFDPLRDRYWQLAATVDQVKVLGFGPKPRRNGRVKFIDIGEKHLGEYWIVLYQGRRRQAMLVCRQTNRSKRFEEKQFIGLYSFDPRVIDRVHRDLTDHLRGRNDTLREYQRLRAVDQTAKQVQTAFNRERQKLQNSLRKLRVNGDQGPARQFASDLDKSLARLKRLKERVAVMQTTSAGDGSND